MRFVTVRDLRSRSAEIWRKLRGEKEMVITHGGKPIAILASVPEGGLEESLAAIRRARATRAVATLQLRSTARAADRLGREEIDAEIASTRKARRRWVRPSTRNMVST